jgi:5-methylthioadenosine/S-adenosylhomocysteine deaminase
VRRSFRAFIPAFLAAAAALGAPGTRPEARARKCDLTVLGGTVVTVDSEDRVYAPGGIAIDAGRILAVGPSAEIRSRFAGREVVSAAGEIVLPGLVNTHTHAAMTLLRGIGADLSLADWLTRKIFPAEAKNVTPAFVRDGTRLACLEMIEGGTTTFADMYYFESDAAEAVRDAGLRAVLGETFIDFPAPDHKDLAETLRVAEAFIRKWKGNPRITPAVAPHAPYTCSKETLLAARRLAEAYVVPIEIHVSETKKEVDEAKAKWGASPIAYLESIGFFGVRPTVAAHVVWPEPGDAEILRSRGVAVSHNPESNMKLASGIAPIAAFEGAGVLWSLGTDGAASNDDLSMFEAMDFAGKLAKVSTLDPTALPARRVVRAATAGGARALGLEDRIGSLEAGKEADVILVDARRSHSVPGDDPFAELVSSLKAGDVTDVWVAGRRLLRRGRVTSLNGASIRHSAAEWRRKIERSLR